MLPLALIDVLTDHWSEFSSGFWVTVRLVVVSFAIAMVVGTLVAALRIAPSKWLQRLGGIYVEVVPQRAAARAAVHLLRRPAAGRAGHQRVGRGHRRRSGLYTAAYVAEALRSGVFSVGKGQIEASLSLGFTYRETLRRIVLPQAFRTVISPLGSLTIAMIKNSAIIGVSLLALPDLLKQARIVAGAHVRDQRGVLLGRRRLPDPDRRGDAASIRDLERRFAIRR